MAQGPLKYLGIAWLSMSVSAWAIEYNIPIDYMQEVPPPVLNGSAPFGSATVDVNTITGDVSVTGTFAGLTSNATAAHIHGLAPAGVSTGVLIGLTPDASTSGNLSGGGMLNPTELAGLLRGETYINIHTPNNGPGEIRGQIVDSDIKVYELSLDSGQSVPPPNLNGATPTGSATVVVDTSSGLVEVSGSYAGMTSDVTAAHLHGLAGPGVATGVLFGFSATGGDAGSFSGAGTLDAGDLAGLLAGNTYINVHTVTNGSGEIRAQVVPEPGSVVLIALGMAGLAARHRRRRR